MSSVGIYLVGYTVLIVGLALGANPLGVPSPWIATGVIILLGSGIMAASSRLSDKDSRDKDPD